MHHDSMKDMREDFPPIPATMGDQAAGHFSHISFQAATDAKRTRNRLAQRKRRGGFLFPCSIM